MSPHENRTNWTELAMKGLQAKREVLDLERTVMWLGEQLRRQFSDVASEPLPEEMLALLAKLNQVAE
ncbi:MAG: NepR family anti-sigma factor [Methylocystis sp.]